MSKIIIADMETVNQLTEISAEESKAIQGGQNWLLPWVRDLWRLNPWSPWNRFPILPRYPL
jgi:hypothetical protein